MESDPNYSTISLATMTKENIYTEATVTSSKLKSEDVKFSLRRKNQLIYFVAVSVGVLLLLLIIGCFIALFLEVANLKSEMPNDAVMLHLQQINEKFASIDERFNSQMQNQTSILLRIENNATILSSKIQQLNTSLVEAKELFVNHIHDPSAPPCAGLPSSSPTSSCAALPPSSPSGYYWVRDSNGSALCVYCDMTRSCGGVTGGWRRVVELDMTNSSHQCPSGLRERIYRFDKRTCVKDFESLSCSSVAISSDRLDYSKVCGKIIAYRFGSVDAFNTGRNDIDNNYVDGVILTYGHPRKHIWTFAAGRNAHSQSICPSCTNDTVNQAAQPPQIVQNDYFCETGTDGTPPRSSTFHGDNPLWDGAGCGPQSTCCSFNNPPWFYKQLPQSTTNNIEMRVCTNEQANQEDVAIEIVEIYVQ